MSAATADVAVRSGTAAPRLRLLDRDALRAAGPWWHAPSTRVQAYRRRFVVAVALATGLAAGVGALREPAGPPAPTPVALAAAPTPAVTVVVQPGQTLWSVAVSNAPAGSSVPAYVEALRSANALEGSSLQAWQVLQLPPAG